MTYKKRKKVKEIITKSTVEYGNDKPYQIIEKLIDQMFWSKEQLLINTWSTMFYLIIMKYRSRTEITVLILEAANGGATKTKIMYKSFLSYAQLKEYFSMLIENALIEYEDGMLNMYRTTEKGLRLLKIYNQIEEIIPQINNN